MIQGNDQALWTRVCEEFYFPALQKDLAQFANLSHIEQTALAAWHADTYSADENVRHGAALGNPSAYAISWCAGRAVTLPELRCCYTALTVLMGHDTEDDGSAN